MNKSPDRCSSEMLLMLSSDSWGNGLPKCNVKRLDYYTVVRQEMLALPMFHRELNTHLFRLSCSAELYSGNKMGPSVISQLFPNSPSTHNSRHFIWDFEQPGQRCGEFLLRNWSVDMLQKILQLLYAWLRRRQRLTTDHDFVTIFDRLQRSSLLRWSEV